MNVKHKTGCPCRVGREVDHRTRCTCGVKVQGIPFSHWQDMADTLVMWELVTAVRRFSGELASIPQQIAAERLLAVAQQYSPDLLAKAKALPTKYPRGGVFWGSGANYGAAGTRGLWQDVKTFILFIF